MKSTKKRVIVSSIVCFLLVVFILLAILQKVKVELVIDKKISEWFSHVSTSWWIEFLKVFTYLGSIYTLAIITLSMLFFKNKWIGCVASMSLLIASLLNVAIKYIIRRPRPEISVIDEIGYSFPSAHAMLTMVVLGFVAYLVIKFVKNKWLKVGLTSLLGLVIFFVGLSRVILGVHFFTDVLAGWIIAIPILIAEISLCNFLMKNPIKPNKRLI